MEELSRKADTSTLGCPEQTHEEASSAWAELVCQERTIHREGRLFYSILFHFIHVCARPNPAWMPEPGAGTGGPGRGRLRGCHQLPPTVTNVPLWTQRLGTEGQTAGRKEGRKEGALEDKVVLWAAIMDI